MIILKNKKWIMMYKCHCNNEAKWCEPLHFKCLVHGKIESISSWYVHKVFDWLAIMKPLRSGICQVQAIVPILLCPQKFWLAQNFLTNTLLSTIPCTRHIPLNRMVFICGLFCPFWVLLHGIMYRSSWIFMT